MSGSANSLTFAQAQRDAERKGCEIRLPNADELFIDIDSDEDYRAFLEQLDIFKEHIEVLWWHATPSKSGGRRWHVVITLGFDVDDRERVIYQALLGSDRKRELLSWIRIVGSHSQHPTLFFERLGRSLRARLRAWWWS